MIRKFYDEFIKMPIDKMAQNIVDMTYSYNATRVPKKHYKSCLEQELIELLNNDSNIETVLLKPYYDLIDTLIKENKKYFYKALIMHEKGIKYNSLDSVNYHALSIVWDYMEDNKLKSIINKDISDIYDDFIKNGVREFDINDDKLS